MPKKKDSIKDEQNNNSITTKARHWVAIGWLENMRPDWQDVIGGLLQYPYCYVVHDKDVDSEGKPRNRHVHIMVSYGNTTTYKSALALFRQLNAPGREAFNTAFKVNNVRHMYEYLIHNTDDAKKKKKHRYDASERVCGNNFDIGLLEQISQADKDRIVNELEDLILDNYIRTYRQFLLYVKNNYDSEYRKVLRSYSGHFDRLIKGNWYESEERRKEERTI